MYVIVRVVANTNKQLIYLMSLSLLLGKITKLTNRSAKWALSHDKLASIRCPAVGAGSAVSSISKVTLLLSLSSSFFLKKT